MRLTPSLRRACALGLLVSVVCGCSGGNGNPGGGGSGPFEVVAGPTGGKLAGLNLPVTLTFSKGVEPTSVGSESIQVVTVTDPSGQATAAAGSVASLTYSISGMTVKLNPTVEFSASGIEYGFLANALYEIAFSPPSSGSSVLSFNGQKLNNPNTTYFFRTPTKGFDFNTGYPHVRAFLVDDPAGVVLPTNILDSNNDQDLVAETMSHFGNPVEVLPVSPPLEVAVTPVRDMVFVFNDALTPGTVLNTIDSSSPSIRVAINTAPLPELLPKTVPAAYSFLHQQGNLTVLRWHPQFIAWPSGDYLFVEVGGAIEDIAGNSKHSVTGSSAADLLALLHVASTPDTTSYHDTEPFDDSAHEDTSVTSAAWASTFPGLLGPVLGGGTGKDGPFIVDTAGTAVNPGLTEVPALAVVNFSTRIASLPTVETTPGGTRIAHNWNFTTLQLPAGWTLTVLVDRDGDGTPDPEEFVVQNPGDPLDGLGAPLALTCSGDVEILGTVTVSGVDAATVVRPETSSDPDYDVYLGQGGVGAVPLLAAGTGGHGGDVLMLKQDQSIATPLKSPPVTAPAPSYQASDGRLLGATGRSTVLTDTTLLDPNTDLFNLLSDPGLAALMAAGELRLQPNLGVGSSLVNNSGTANQSIDENHPTFVIENVSVVNGQSTITVRSDPGDPTLKQNSKNIGAQPIAAAGDCYLVGRLHGRAGDDVTQLARGGPGAEPYVVVNEGALGISTTSGGGGGGGSIDAGSAGQSDGPASDPTVNQRGGSGGIALDDSPGAPGGLGTVRGVGRVINDTEFDLQSQTAGRPLAELSGAALVGGLLIPNSAVDGWMFSIDSFDGLTFVIHRIQLDATDIGLTSGPGSNGPALLVGHDYPFVVVPSLAVGGAGGGGSGVSVTGTTNNTFTVLPVLAPGASGGAGGGSLSIETAGDMLLGPLSRLFARGGKGGAVFDEQTKFAGGGGGGGGNLVIRAGRSLDIFQGALISVAGGSGGSVTGLGKGGNGGGGFIRVENFDDTLITNNLKPYTDPPVNELNVGRMLGQPQGIGQSQFYPALVVNPEYKDVTVHYVADTNGDHVTEALDWSFGATGVSGGTGQHEDPPFRILFNSTGTNENGFLDSGAVNASFSRPSDLVSARTGFAYDATGGVLLYCVGERATQIHRLDPATLQPVASGPQAILLPSIPSVTENVVNLVSMAVDSTGVQQEIFLLERVTHRVHVIDLATAAFLRTITLPMDLSGGMTYDPVLDRLVFARNGNGTLVTFAPRDAAAAQPNVTDYAPIAPLAQYVVSRDAAPLETEITGLAYDPVGPALWCLDAMAGTLFQVSLAPGFEGTSVTGSERLSPLTSAGQGVVPSSLTFNGTSLFLVHAIDSADCRTVAVAPGAVSLSGAPLNLASFGTLLPEGARAITDGQIFLRFQIMIDGVHNDGVTQYGMVRIDSVDVRYENDPF